MYHISSETGAEECAVRTSLGSFPLTRARLQGLKQLSVEKLANLKQKLSETRTRGLSSSSLKRKGQVCFASYVYLSISV